MKYIYTWIFIKITGSANEQDLGASGSPFVVILQEQKNVTSQYPEILS